ncbi:MULTISPECIES: ATP-binding protein [Curtobacterium]|uniref:sensor histidine kinase n=1 Tax=Curtobacterium flaccumfaciens TaxID=2035 RepID=UPI003EE5544B
MAPRRWSIAQRLFALQLLFVVVGVAIGGAWSWASARADLEHDAAEKCTAVAVSVARNPFVVDEAGSADPSERLEPYALDLMRRTHTDFITIMAPDRTRWTHPDRSELGKPFQGTIAPALAGRTFTETYTGTLGPSVRAVTPITDDSGSVIGLVSAGVTVANISGALLPRLGSVIGIAAAVVVVSALFSWLLSRYLGRVTAGRGPEELARVFASYEGVLHSVHEGLIVVDRSGAVVLHNDRAAELLHLPAPDERHDPIPLADVDVPEGLRVLLASGDRAVDERYETEDRVLVVSQEMAFSRGASKPLGTVATIRDETELLQLTGELTATRSLSEALRTQTHEFANRLHTIVALVELGRTEEAIRFASDEIDRHTEGGRAEDLAEDLAVGPAEDLAEDGGPEPTAGSVAPGVKPDAQPIAPADVVAAVLDGKRHRALRRGVALSVDTAALRESVPAPALDVVTVLGNLVDNAVDAAAENAGDHPEVVVTVATTPAGARFTVRDSGPGIPDLETASVRGWSTKAPGPTGRGVGLGLVQDTLERLGGTIAVTTGTDGSTFVVDLPHREGAA